MDEAYNQHSKQRRKNRSSNNINHLSLAPLTSKLPITDPDALPDSDSLTAPPRHNTSYLQGKSAPTTPGILSRSAARSPSRPRHSVAFGPGVGLPKSKSASHLTQLHDRKHHRRPAASGAASPTHHRRDDVSAAYGGDGDWLFRAAALMSSEAREFKGQSWLVSRASSTSLAGGLDLDEEAEEQMERERERESRRGSRNGSVTNFETDPSPFGSRRPSRSHSRVGSGTHMFSPSEHHPDDSYFPQSPEGDYIAGPDFVNLDERLEALGGEPVPDDEAAVRRLVRRGRDGGTSWMGNILGWSLFSVEEHEEESDSDSNEAEETDDLAGTSTPSTPQPGGACSSAETMPAPMADEGGWKDAAWLLSVASKVIL